MVTKSRAHGERLLLVAVLYVPTYELVRHGGRSTESGMVLVSQFTA